MIELGLILTVFLTVPIIGFVAILIKYGVHEKGRIKDGKTRKRNC